MVSLYPHPIIMATSPSWSSLFLSQRNPHLLSNPQNPHLTPLFTFPPRAMRGRVTYCTLNSSPPPPPPVTPPPEKKSFAVFTGEFFLGLAARLIGKGSSSIDGVEYPVTMFERTKGNVIVNVKVGEGKERIARVVKDDVEPSVVWEQREKDVEAEKERRVVTSPGFSFSAAGLLFPYHLGVAHFLIENGYIKETTPLAGSSAGAIVCAVVASGSNMKDALKATKILADDCRTKGTAFRLGAVLRDVLEDFLPDDAHTRSNGRVRVAVTEILWRPRGLLVDQFDSRDDLINAVITSSFIPGYLAPRPATMFRNRLCIDGGLTLFMPPTSAVSKTLLLTAAADRVAADGNGTEETPWCGVWTMNSTLTKDEKVRVCAFPANRMGLQGIGISPDCNPENQATARELFNWALEPADDLVLDRLFELGYLDAAVWAQKNPVEETVKDDSPCIGN